MLAPSCKCSLSQNLGLLWFQQCCVNIISSFSSTKMHKEGLISSSNKGYTKFAAKLEQVIFFLLKMNSFQDFTVISQRRSREITGKVM